MRERREDSFSLKKISKHAQILFFKLIKISIKSVSKFKIYCKYMADEGNGGRNEERDPQVDDKVCVLHIFLLFIYKECAHLNEFC